ncbi:MAG: ribonuclease H-like domain-containing protein [Armatimonadota bacterium]
MNPIWLPEQKTVLEEVVPCRVLVTPTGLTCLEIELPAHELEVEAIRLHRQFVSLPLSAESERFDPFEIIFLDIETTGLSDTPLFLVGLMECTQECFVFRQYFARTFFEEPGVIVATSTQLERAGVLFTFNGISFDLPYIQRIATATGVRFIIPGTHIDLLQKAKRCYSGVLPNYRLQTLENLVCGRSREDDIPSAEVPSAYLDYLHTGKVYKIIKVLRHNLYDLMTMADLVTRMWRE